MTHPARRIALFGGSFDPVHLGHLEIAHRAVEAMQLDEVRFIPCRISPHKLGHPPAPAEDRIAMLEQSTADLPWAEVDSSEITLPPPSYSYLTAQRVHDSNPAAKLFWLLGRDQWESLPRWKEPEKLRELLDFIVFSRDGVPEPRAGWRMHHIEGLHPASSSAIRRSWPPQCLPRCLPDSVMLLNLLRCSGDPPSSSGQTERLMTWWLRSIIPIRNASCRSISVG